MRRDERGSVLPLVIGFAAILALAVGVTVDASSAYLRRQGLATLADDTALAAATWVPPDDLYAGIPADRLPQREAAAAAAARSYLAQSAAFGRYRDLRVSVTLSPDGTEVHVHLSARLDLPLKVPGSPAAPTISADGSAASIVAAG